MHLRPPDIEFLTHRFLGQPPGTKVFFSWVTKAFSLGPIYNGDMAQTDCRLFTGYRPCHRPGPCDFSCQDYRPVSTYLLVVHLEALGSVLRGTSILPALKRKYPESHVTWVTQAPADQLLSNNPYIDKVLTISSEQLLELSAREFDAAFVVDKSLKAAGVVKGIKCGEIFGFVADAKTGAVLPATSAATELWEVGLSNHKKFYENKKPETQLVLESLELGPYARDPYLINLNQEELLSSEFRRRQWAPLGETIIGINTGCSSTIPYKKMSIERHRELIGILQSMEKVRVVMLGGPEDSERNRAIGEGLSVIQSTTEKGLRDGLVSVSACDIVVSGDSLGMHMAIGLKKWVVAWFGPTCAHEIDFFDRGSFVLADVPCGPCWRRSCHRQEMCYDRVPLDQLLEGVRKGIAWHSCSTKPHLSGTFFSPSL